MKHAKAETRPAPYACPKWGSQTVYRVGKNGMFLSCGTYPACEYAAPIDREGLGPRRFLLDLGNRTDLPAERIRHQSPL